MNNEVNAIRPAMEILRELDEGRFLDKLALAFHEATDGVRALGKTAKIGIVIDIAPFKAQLVEPVITMEVEITTKLPRPDASRALFYIDGDGNPVTQQQRQRGLDLTVAARSTGEIIETTNKGAA